MRRGRKTRAAATIGPSLKRRPRRLFCEMGRHGGWKIVVWKKSQRLVEQHILSLLPLRVDQTALNRALHLAHGAGVETHALGAAFLIDDPYRRLRILTDGSGGTGFVAGTAIDALICDIQTHSDRL